MPDGLLMSQCSSVTREATFSSMICLVHNPLLLKQVSRTPVNYPCLMMMVTSSHCLSHIQVTVRDPTLCLLRLRSKELRTEMYTSLLQHLDSHPQPAALLLPYSLLNHSLSCTRISYSEMSFFLFPLYSIPSVYRLVNLLLRPTLPSFPTQTQFPSPPAP